MRLIKVRNVSLRNHNKRKVHLAKYEPCDDPNCRHHLLTFCNFVPTFGEIAEGELKDVTCKTCLAKRDKLQELVNHGYAVKVYKSLS